jgi:ABC-type lipoprotein export system ATPase subunit
MGSFDLQTNKVLEHFKGDIDLSGDWRLGVIYGASGTGKSTISRQIFGDDYFSGFEYRSSCVLDDMPKEKTTEQITSAFNSVGFATVWSWLKPYSVLSTGEKMRVDLARCILDGKQRIVFDEYTSVVNREVAKIGSTAIAKTIRKQKKQFVAVACHSDILEWLEPDWTFCTDTMTFERRLLRRPEIKLDIFESDVRAWEVFKKYHYLSNELHRAAKVYVAAINQELVALCAFIHFPHPHERRFKRVTRLVVLPDYQGIGIGNLFCTEMAKRYKEEGFRPIITTVLKSLKLDKMGWVRTRIGRAKPEGNTSSLRGIVMSSSKHTFSYEYIGTS